MSLDSFKNSIRGWIDLARTRSATGDVSVEAIRAIAMSAPDIAEVSEELAAEIRKHVSFDRLTVSYVDLERGTFTDALEVGMNVPGRQAGRVRPLEGTEVEAAIESGSAILAADGPETESLSRFPWLGPALDAGLRSMIATPLYSGARAVGALVIASANPGTYSRRELEAARRIGELIGDPVASSRMYTAARREARELATLNEIGRAVGEAAGLSEVFERIAQAARRLIPFDRLALTLLDLEAEEGTVAFFSGSETTGWGPGKNFALSGTSTEAVLRSRSGRLERTGSPVSSAGAVGPGVMMEAPLISRGRVNATLTFRSNSPDAYSERELALAERIASQVAGAVATSREYDRLRHEMEEGVILAEIGRLMLSRLDIGDVFDEFARQVKRLLPVEWTMVALIDPDERKGKVAWASGDEFAGWKKDAPFEIGEVAAEALLVSGTGISAYAESPDKLAARVPEWSFILAGEIRSITAVPLRSEGRVVAALVLCSRNSEGGRPRDMAMATRIGDQIAGPIAAFRFRATVRREAKEGEVLSEIGRTLASSTTIDDVWEDVSEQVHGLIGFDRMAIKTLEIDGGARTRTFRAGSEPEDEEGESTLLSETILEEALRKRAPYLVQERSTRDASGWPPLTRTDVEAGIRSFIAAPLVSDGEVLGAMSLEAVGPEAYGARELALAGKVGSRLAGAIATERLNRKLERQAAEWEVLGEVGRTIASAPSVETAYDAVADQLNKLIDFDRLEIGIVEADGSTLKNEYAWGVELAGDLRGSGEPITGAIAEEVVRSQSAVRVDTETPEEALGRFPALGPHIDAGLRTFMTLPLLSNGEVIGVVGLSSTGQNAFGARDQLLAERVSLELAAAIANSRLRGGQEANTSELARLAEISRVITSSVDIGEVYDTVADKVRKIIPFDRMAIWAVDLRRENLVAAYVRGYDGPDLERGSSFPLKSAAARGMLSMRSALKADGDSLRTLAEQFDGLLGDTRARPKIVLAPLLSGNEPVGMLALSSTGSTSYTERDVSLAEKIADQIAGAVANAQVYIECRQVEEAVREAVERLDLAVRGSGDGLWDWKVPENEMWWSPRYKELVGYRDEEGATGQYGWEARLHPEDREWVLRALNDHLGRRVPYDVEYRLRTSPVDYRWFSDRGQAIWDKRGRAIRMSGSLRDINDAKESGAASYAGPYDLRLPLAQTEAFRQALLSAAAGAEDGGGKDYLTGLAPAAQRVSRLADGLHTLAWSIDAELRREQVDLSSLARSVAAKLRKTYAGRRVKFSVAKGLGVVGDPRLLRVLLENLLDNAWKYTAKHARARVELGTGERDGNTFFYLRDDGAGFDMAQADRLFGLFQRLHSPADFDGDGVGLATVRQIVSRHGGHVWAEGEVEGGATFYFTL